MPAFVRRMNERAHQLGMRADAVLLRERSGRSRAFDPARPAAPRPGHRCAATTFTTITATRFRRIPAPHGRDRVIQNRNALLWLYAGAFGTKTGTTAGAGACLVASAARDGRRLVAIVLDAPREPFSSAATLLEYGFEGWEHEDLVAAGDPLGTVAIRGGTVPVVAGADLDALVPVRADDRGPEPRR